MWIEITDPILAMEVKMPEEDQQVLAVNEGFVVPAIYKEGQFYRYPNTVDHDITSNYFYAKVTKWQPFPEA